MNKVQCISEESNSFLELLDVLAFYQSFYDEFDGDVVDVLHVLRVPIA